MTTNEKQKYVLDNNTYFFKNEEFEELYDSEIGEMTQLLLTLKRDIAESGLKKDIVLKFITERPNGLLAILILLGLSRESLLRLITFIRVNESPELYKLVLKDQWEKEKDLIKFREWSFGNIQSYIQKNKSFALGIVNLFLEGGSCKAIRENLPLFEYKKLDIGKISFEIDSLIDTLIRYRSKGSWKADKRNNPEGLIEEILAQHKIPFQKGNGFRNIVGRDIDFVIPSKADPLILIECSYVVTTASGMGDKASNEIAVSKKIKEHFNNNSKFWGFVDGIGWYVRRGDLNNLVSAFEEVYTFKEAELERFALDARKTLEQNGKI